MENTPEKIEVNETVNQLETKAEIAVIEEADRVSSLAKEYIAEEKKYLRKDQDFVPNEDEVKNPTILERIIELVESQSEEFTSLKHVNWVFKAWYNEPNSLLTELSAYRKDHAMLFIMALHEMLLCDGGMHSLAKRAEIDYEEINLYSEDAFVDWFEQEMLPYFKVHGDFYREATQEELGAIPEIIEVMVEKNLDVDSAVKEVLEKKIQEIE